ncbi:hypothetical protein M406DRAFT_52917 [Cryphonectria parasitica EP155]|uniref:Fe2OG dioxygenase domain-containing protein n=1 Tax=Cryphonectria parasitica (strain ATCC 38755 / EP155) TaxID=660469 RepID=A0A9P5CHT3_CRYP1|nr:uncharacterized protein M406DRAFT_52917 [Cryphonectria parasitica EP155]KAF3760309.1 hypothetical protein M406DRAFT_52917 [Cryphonectria parasitica EP155]
MAKSKAKRKHQAAQAVSGSVAKKIKTDPSSSSPVGSITLTGSSSCEPKLLQTIVPDEDLEITVETLRALAENPGLIKSKACKDLRAAVFDFKQASTTGAIASIDANLTSRISGALADQNYVDARIMLAEMKIRGQKPKLGALCRWVRDLDVISGLAEQRDGGAKRTAQQHEVLQVLDAILRVVGPVDYTAGGDNDDEAGGFEVESGGPMMVRRAWDLRDGRERKMVYDSVLDGTLTAAVSDKTTSRFRIIETTPGLQRKPPNHHPAVLHASQDNTITFSSPPPVTTHHKHPVVPNLHLIKDVLTADECIQIIGAAEKIGFTPDAPIRAEGEEVSILAHNFYWIADAAFCEGLWRRVEPFVPASVGGRSVRGLNRRFRVYRYVPGAEYRAHIDGAWPPSGISPQDSYIYDSSPPEAKQSSLFTFLIYLNDEFEAGETTYFLPGTREGTLNAYPLKPIQGSVALFPHGEVDGNLLHEGTGVRQGDRPSAKYVIRTDVEYDVDLQKTAVV